MTDIGAINQRWATILIDQLVKQGVMHACVAPGSRSSPLVLACSTHKLPCTVHFDERGLGFYALGMAKASRKPPCIIVTSGTAVAHLVPALIEAHFSRIPLMILTADRPPELHSCGANQTCDQLSILKPYCRWQVNLPCPTTEIDMRYLVTTIATAYQHACRTPSGPVHINCMFREPLFSLNPITQPSISSVVSGDLTSLISTKTLKQWAHLISQSTKGVIIAASLPENQQIQHCLALARTLKWPILADILSQVRSHGLIEEVIPYYDTLLHIDPSFDPDLILHLGDRLVSKTLQKWLCTKTSIPYLQVTNHPDRQDPFHQVTHRIDADPELFAQSITPLINPLSDDTWIHSWQRSSRLVTEHIDTFFQENQNISEPGLIYRLHDQLSDRSSLFIGNSMPIRDADHFLFPKHKIGPIFSNRGASGIEGNIATAVGIATASQQPIIALMGDQTFLYDLNSLSLVRTSQVPIMIIVINNQGGGIFSFLPITQVTQDFKALWTAEHPYTFEKAAELFQIPYARPKTYLEWKELLTHHQSILIEVQTNSHQNVLVHQEICKPSFFSTVS